MRGGDQAHVDRLRLAPAETHHLAFLERAQQAHLQPDLEVADLVQEERAAVRQLELARARLHSGRDASLDAEELALEQRLGQRGAVHRHQRPRPSRALMQQAGDQLLAGAALAPHQHVDAARRDALDHLEHPPYRRGLSDDALSGDLVNQALLEQLVLLLQTLAAVAQGLEPPQPVERHSGDRGHRLQEPTVLLRERVRATAQLLVDHREVAQHVAPIADRHARSSRSRVRRAGRRAAPAERRSRAARRPRSRRAARGAAAGARPPDGRGCPRLAARLARDHHRAAGSTAAQTAAGARRSAPARGGAPGALPAGRRASRA